MLIYYKRYTVILCVIAVALPVVVSTVYPFITGQIMASTLPGLITLFLLFAAGMLVGYRIMDGIAERRTESMLSLYNTQCNPEGLISEGADLARNITFPCNEAGAWFMSYYAQALLDAGKLEQAKEISAGLGLTVKSSKNDAGRCAVICNLVPLYEKLNPPQDSLGLIEEGISLCAASPSPEMQVRHQYLESQLKIMKARCGENWQESAVLDESVKDAPANPMRIRVEFAFSAAMAYFHLGNSLKEQENLRFVVEHGNRLALVAQAEKRLA